MSMDEKIIDNEIREILGGVVWHPAIVDALKKSSGTEECPKIEYCTYMIRKGFSEKERQVYSANFCRSNYDFCEEGGFDV